MPQPTLSTAPESVRFVAVGSALAGAPLGALVLKTGSRKPVGTLKNGSRKLARPALGAPLGERVLKTDSLKPVGTPQNGSRKLVRPALGASLAAVVLENGSRAVLRSGLVAASVQAIVLGGSIQGVGAGTRVATGGGQGDREHRLQASVGGSQKVSDTLQPTLNGANRRATTARRTP